MLHPTTPMIFPPESLGPADFLITVKPKGNRCLVITRKKKTYSIYQNGKVHLCFYSILPNGSSQSFENKTMALDCIYCEEI